MKYPPSPATTLKRLRRERDAFARLVLLPQVSFRYRQRLRKAIAIRERKIARMEPFV